VGEKKPESGKQKIGRNYPCPSGQSVKFKKRLAAHRELNEKSKPGNGRRRNSRVSKNYRTG
jgi:hypothetical protein